MRRVSKWRISVVRASVVRLSVFPSCCWISSSEATKARVVSVLNRIAENCDPHRFFEDRAEPDRRTANLFRVRDEARLDSNESDFLPVFRAFRSRPSAKCNAWRTAPGRYPSRITADEKCRAIATGVQSALMLAGRIEASAKRMRRIEDAPDVWPVSSPPAAGDPNGGCVARRRRRNASRALSGRRAGCRPHRRRAVPR